MKGRKTWALLSVAAAMAIGCTPGGGGGGPNNPGGGGPTDGPPREFTGEPSQMPAGPAPEGTEIANVDFTTADVPFRDPVSQSDIATGSFITGKWTAGSGAYVQEEPGSSTKLSIRSYTGNPGTRYRVEVTGWVYRVFTSDPAKDQGVVVLMPFYKDSTHYVIASAGPKLQEAWVCNGQLPGGSWPTSNKLWGEAIDPPRTVGQATTWTCDVDTVANTMTVYVNGTKRGTVTNPLISGAGTVALASNGSQVKYTNFKLYRLAGSTTAPTPAPSVAPTPRPTTTPTPVRTPTPAPVRTPTPAPVDDL